MPRTRVGTQMCILGGGATRSVRSASSASGASEATVFTSTATFIRPFALVSPDTDTDVPARHGALHGPGANADDQTDADDALARDRTPRKAPADRTVRL